MNPSRIFNTIIKFRESAERPKRANKQNMKLTWAKETSETI